MQDHITEVLKKVVEQEISARIDEEINRKVNQFHKELTNRKDSYISEIMKGIRIYHEQDTVAMSQNYKILFENINRLEDK